MTTASNFSDGAGNGYDLSGKRQNRTTTALGEAERLPQRDSPLGVHAYQLHGEELQTTQPRLVLFPEAIKQFSAHATSDLQSEVGGVLLGAAYRQGAELYVEVRAALPVLSNDHGPVHFTFNADAWSQIHRDRTEQYPDLNIVGWFHTHPGLGIFFSGDDVIVHSAAFVLPWHVAIVVDPLSKRMGAFAWDARKLEALPGFFEILTAPESPSRLRWKLQRGEIWNESYMERLVAQRRNQSEARIGWPRLTTRHAVLMSTIAILLSLGLLVGGLLPLHSQNQALHSVVSALAERTIQQANASGAASCTDKSLQIYAPLPDDRIPYGTEITLVGSADATTAASYRLDVRPAGEQTWWSLGSFRRSISGGEFLRWDTTSFAPGSYQLRLSAADTSGEVMSEPAACIIRFQLVSSRIQAPQESFE